jgi:CRP-like cAMP-binding protein
MARPDPRKTKDEAAEHVSRGRWKKALDCYRTLEKLEPNDGSWPQKLADMHRRLAQVEDATAALIRAADIYAKNGFLLKAIAVCKLILEIDPRRTEIEDRLASLYAARNAVAPPRAAVVMQAVAVAEPEPSSPPLAPAGAPIGEIALGRTVPGARTSRDIPAQGDLQVFEIPLDDDPAPRTAADAARALLPKTPLFSALAEDKLRLLIGRVDVRRLDAGEMLFKKGDPGEALFVVAAGEVVVTMPGRDDREVEVNRIPEGGFFGEIALLTDQPRSATVRAAVDTDLLVIDRHLVNALIADSPEVLRVLLRFMRDRLIVTLVETNPLFTPFSGPERRALAERFCFLEAEPGIRIIDQGTRVAGLFVILCGQVDVLVDGAKVASLDSGAVFGEVSLLTHAPAMATIRARSKVLLLELPRADFQEVIMTHPQVLEYIGGLADDRRKQVEALQQNRLRVL